MTPAEEWDTSADPRRLLSLLEDKLKIGPARLLAVGYLRWDHATNWRLSMDESKFLAWFEQLLYTDEPDEHEIEVLLSQYRRNYPYNESLMAAANLRNTPFTATADHLRRYIPSLFHDHAMMAARHSAGPSPPDVHPGHPWHRTFQAAYFAAMRPVADLLRCVFPNPYRPVAFDPGWRTDTAVGVAGQMFDAREFSAMPILADALQDAGCENSDVLGHCRGGGPHARGCWVVDAVI